MSTSATLSSTSLTRNSGTTFRSWVSIGLTGVVNCEGDGDVVASLLPFAQVVLHGVQVVEVGVRLRVHQDGEVEEDGEGQVEVEREEGEVKERRSCMKMG